MATKEKSSIKETNQKVREVVADRIIKTIESGKLDWSKMWISSDMPLPFNYVSKKQYSGGNLFYLFFFTQYKYKAFLTLKQVLGLGGRVKKEEFSNWYPICLYNRLYWHNGKSITLDDVKKLSDEERKEVRSATTLRYFRVYNIEQTDLKYTVPTPEKFEGKARIQDAEKLLKNYSENECKINIVQSSQAFYSPVEDSITLPKFEQFKTAESFYSVAFHEMVHSTGHKNRLDRIGVSKDRNKETYAREELVAEFGASFLNAKYGTFESTLLNSSAYIQGWKSRINDDPKLIMDVLTDTGKAVDYIEKYA